METRSDPHRTAGTVALSLLVFPLLSVPIYLIGQRLADALDDDSTNGVVALGLGLGLGLPAILSLVFARRWGGLGWSAATSLGVGAGLVSASVLIIAAVLICSPTACIR